MIDINPPALTGDRAFDLATMLFYLYGHRDLRERRLVAADLAERP